MLSYLYSNAGKHSIHEYPKAWMQSKNVLEEALRSCDIDASVVLATLGSWRIGYAWSGGFRVSFKLINTGAYKDREKIKRFYAKKINGDTFDTKEVFEEIRAYCRKYVEKFVYLAKRGKYIIDLYHSGLIPKKVARKHADKVEAKFGEKAHDYYTNIELQNFISDIADEYISKYAICKCGAKGLHKNLPALLCRECGATFNYNNGTFSWS